MIEDLITLSDFSELINDYARDFVGRRWLDERLLSLLDEQQCRLVLLTGAPGVGKTAFLAHLAATNSDWLRYFVRTDSRVFLRPGDARTFLLTIGAQLAALKPELFHPDTLDIAVNQEIDTIAESGEVVGISVEELRASPFVEFALKVTQRIRRVDGRSVALQIRRLSVDTRAYSMPDLQYLALIHPLRILKKLNPQARIVVIIDGLDEVLYSPSDPDIVRALVELPELDSLDNLRMVIASREDPEIIEELSSLKGLRRIQFQAMDAENQKDLESYAKRVTDRIAGAIRFEHFGLTRPLFLNSLLLKSSGNFLYLRNVLHSIEMAAQDQSKIARLEPLLNLQSLPEGLPALYAHFLKSVKEWCASEFSQKTWTDYLRPVLAMLAVSREPITLSHLSQFTGIDIEDVALLLRELHQFVEISNSAPLTYRIYHSSFTQFLTDSSNDAWRINARRYHDQLAKYYLQTYSGNWRICDLYGLRHLPAHLASAENVSALSALLLRFDWLSAKLGAVTIQEIIEDFNYAARCPPWTYLAETFRLASHVLARDPTQLSSQLFGRLVGQADPETRALLESCVTFDDHPWLRPIRTCLVSPKGSLRRTIRHGGRVNAVALSPDGQRIISGASDAIVWDARSGQQRSIFNGHRADVTAVVFSPDGDWAISGARDYSIKVWNTSNGEEIATLADERKESGFNGVNRLAIANGSSLVIAALEGQVLEVFSLKDLSLHGTLLGHDPTRESAWWESNVTDVAIAPDGRTAVSVSDDGTVIEWNLETCRIRHKLTRQEGSASALAIGLISSGRQAVVGSPGEIRVWDLSSWAFLKSIPVHSLWRLQVVSGPDRVAYADGGTRVHILDFATGREIAALEEHTDRVNDFVVSGNTAVTGSSDGTVKVWDLDQAAHQDPSVPHNAAVSGLAILPDSTAVISISPDHMICEWGLLRGELRRSLAHDPGSSLVSNYSLKAAVAINGDASRIFVTMNSSSLTAFVWPSAAVAWEYKTKSKFWITEFALYPDGSRIIVKRAHGDKFVVLDAEHGRQIAAFGTKASSCFKIIVTPDNQFLTAACWNKIEIWSLVDYRHVGSLEDTGAYGLWTLASSSDGSLVAAAGKDRMIRCWELKSGRLISVFNGHEDEIYDVQFLPGSTQLLATVSRDMLLKVWRIHTGEIVTSYFGDGSLRSCISAPNLSRIVVGDDRGKLHFLEPRFKL